MIRTLDIVFALTGLLFGAPVFAALFLAGYFYTGSPLFRQRRVGLNGRRFELYKFRTMSVGTASVATHLAEASSVTPLGRFLRRTKLDELPQLWNVLKGDMSLVGPRPCLPEQEVLIKARTALGVLAVRPGITGLAQIQGIDMSRPQKLAQTDAVMMDHLSVKTYFWYIFQTFVGKGRGDKVRQG
jgi:lipopolysaccharide/colanic/teichoic acid biosynthesis glycosyltransferase